MSLSPKDMDFMEAKHTAAREIALAFGVPPMLLGIPGDNTYSNYQEANRVFWRADRAAAGAAHRLVRSRSGWRRPSATACGSRSTPTASTALAADRAALWERVSKAPFLTVNEKRAAMGYGPVEGGDRLGESRCFVGVGSARSACRRHADPP